MGQPTYSINVRMSGVDQAVSGFDRIANAAAQTSRRMEQESQRAARAYKTMTSTIDAVSHGFNRGISTGREIGGIWRSQADSLRAYVDEALRLAKAQEKFKVLNLGDSENQRAFAAVRQTVDSIKGLNLADVTEQIVDIHQATGDLSHAIEMLPQGSKFRFAFETLLGDKFSPEQIEEQLQNAMKVLESMGKFAKGKDEAEKAFNVIAQMMAGTSGRVKPSELLQFARRGNPAVSGLSDQGLRNMTAPIQELSGAGAGVALQSLYQALVGGVMKPSSAAEFQRLGLIDPHKIQFGRAQKIKKLLPGANKLGDLMLDDPLTAADALMKAMAAKGINTLKDSEIRRELTVLFQNRNAQRLMNILTTQRAQVTKESNIAAGAKNIEEMYSQALDSPMGKMKVFENNLKNLEAEIGGPLLSALTSIAGAAMPLMKLAAAHPQIAMWTIGLLKFTSAVAQTSAALRMSGIAGWVKSLFSSSDVAAAGSVARTSGMSIAGKLATGLSAGLVGVGLYAIIETELELAAAKSRAKEVGEQIGQMLMEGMRQKIEGKLSVEAGKEVEKVQGPEIGRKTAHELQIGELGIGPLGFPSEMMGLIKDITMFSKTPTADRPPAQQRMIAEQGEEFRRALAKTSITTPERLSGFLQESHKILEGHTDLYLTINRLAREEFPQLAAQMDKMQGLGPAATDATTAIQRMTSVANEFGFQRPQPFFPTPAPGMPGIRPPKGEFHFDRLYPSRAMGGDVLGKGFVEVHPGERIWPANVTRGLSQRARAFGEAGGEETLAAPSLPTRSIQEGV